MPKTARSQIPKPHEDKKESVYKLHLKINFKLIKHSAGGLPWTKVTAAAVCPMTRFEVT